MKNTVAILLTGLLSIGASTAVFACGGAKKAEKASSAKVESVQAVPAADVKAPVAVEANEAKMSKGQCDVSKSACAASAEKCGMKAGNASTSHVSADKKECGPCDGSKASNNSASVEVVPAKEEPRKAS